MRRTCPRFVAPMFAGSSAVCDPTVTPPALHLNADQGIEGSNPSSRANSPARTGSEPPFPGSRLHLGGCHGGCQNGAAIRRLAEHQPEIRSVCRRGSKTVDRAVVRRSETFACK